jgi:hypothetical protein
MSTAVNLDSTDLHRLTPHEVLTPQSTIPSKAFYEKFLEEIRATYSPDKIKGIHESTLSRSIADNRW